MQFKPEAFPLPNLRCDNIDKGEESFVAASGAAKDPIALFGLRAHGSSLERTNESRSWHHKSP